MPNFTTDQLLCLQRVLVNDIEISGFDEQDYTDVAQMEYFAERARCLEIINNLFNVTDALSNLKRGLS